MAARGAVRVTAVDMLRSNCVILRGFLEPSGRLAALMEELNALPSRPGYITSMRPQFSAVK